MVHKVYLFIHEVHFKMAIECADGYWYVLEYAGGGGKSSGSVPINAKVTVNKYKQLPAGEKKYMGSTNMGLQDIIDYARNQSGFHLSQYDVFANNCRQFVRIMAREMGIEDGFEAASKGYFATGC